MENITVSITEEQIREALQNSVGKILKDDYNNPVKKAFEESISQKQGEIKKVVDEIIAAAITDPQFKAKIAETVIARMVESAMKIR